MFYHDHSPNIAMPPDPGANFENFYISPSSILNLRKGTKFGENGSRTKSYRQKAKLGVENTSSAYRVKSECIEK